MNNLGLTMRDMITGFKGVATGYVNYITGCNQYLIVPSMKDDGSIPESNWIDEQRLELLDRDRIVLDNTASTGPDKSPPKL